MPAAVVPREHLQSPGAGVDSARRRGYPRRGGRRISSLPDYIDAHAAIERFAILTRDAARYRSYFPTIEVLVLANAG